MRHSRQRENFTRVEPYEIDNSRDYSKYSFCLLLLMFIMFLLFAGYSFMKGVPVKVRA